MTAPRPFREFYWYLGWILFVTALLGFQIWQDKKSNERRVGITTETGEQGLTIRRVTPGWPAALAGLKAGDRLLAIDGQKTTDWQSYDRAVAGFVPGAVAHFRIVRGSEELDLAIHPGVPQRWGRILFNVLLVLAYLSIGPLLLRFAPSGLRSDLVGLFSLAVAIELVLPLGGVGAVGTAIAANSAFSFITGIQMSLELHLASVLPDRHPMLEGRPWIVPGYYTLGLAVALAASLTYALDNLGHSPFPWSNDQIQSLLFDWGLPIWAGAVFLLLGSQALRHPEPRVRRQAGLLLLGAAPWVATIFVGSARQLLGQPPVPFLDEIWPAVMFCYPLAVAMLLLSELSEQRRLVLRLGQELQGASTLQDIARVAGTELRRVFTLRHIAVLFRDHKSHDFSSQFSSASGSPLPQVPGNLELLRLLEGSSTPLEWPSPLLRQRLPAHEWSWLEPLDTRLLAPLIGRHQRLLGLVVLGAKTSGAPLVARDIALVKALAAQVALVVETADLEEEIDSRDRERRDVLTHLRSKGFDLLKECPTCGTCADGVKEVCPLDGAQLAVTLPIERTIEGKYRLERRLGAGGMGAVYEARDLRLGRSVAVKILLGRLFGDARSLRRFEREARLAARLHHPHIVTVHDYGSLPHAGAFLVMEHLRGHTLDERINRSGAVTPELLAVWLGQLADALRYAHQHRVLHRDLKPANVFLAEGEQLPSVTLLDLGLAKEQWRGATDSSVTASSELVGTLAYMAPEQLLGADVDERTDVWALGVLTVQALTGSRPFEGTSGPDQVQRTLHGTYRFPGESESCRYLDLQLQRCLAKRPEDRLRNMTEVQEQLLPAVASLVRSPSAARQHKPPAADAPTLAVRDS